MTNNPPKHASWRRALRSVAFASLGTCSVVALSVSACSGGSAPSAVEPVAQAPITETPPAESEPTAAVEPKPVDPEALAKQEKAAKAIAELELAIAAETARWTEDIENNTKKLVETSFGSAKKAIAAAVKGPQRAPGNAERDPARHPVETLLFMGLKPTSRVVEMGVGAGWYTEILAPVVAAKGLLIAGTYDAEGPIDKPGIIYGKRQQALMAKSPALFGKVETFRLGEEGPPTIADAGSVDLVLAIREMHGWQSRGTLDDNLSAIVEVLAPGGRFGIVQHRAKADAVAEESAKKGYLPEAWLIKKVEDAGLKFVAKSKINANPKDTKDYEGGVWTLPPSLRADDPNHEKYKAIGESDRMTLLFEKPKTKTKTK